jgi:uncharacterized membrane protein
MIVLAALVFLPVGWVAGFGIGMIATHNLLDPYKAQDFGSLAWFWGILRGGYALHLGSHFEFRPSYAVVPWAGVMAAGYGFGPLLLLKPARRFRTLSWLGLGLIALFVVLRLANAYGDPQPWSAKANFSLTVLSFINCSKYPPSLLFLLMTLGPAILLLGVLERVSLQAPPSGSKPKSPDYPSAAVAEISNPVPRLPRLTEVFIVFGRVPLFFYLLHLPLIHLLAVLVSLPHYRVALGSFYYARPDPASGYGQDLWVVYVVWIVAVLILFPLCRWFARVKAHRGSPWLSYL